MVRQSGYKDIPYVSATNLVGVVLAGGRSTRMGCDKATLRYGKGRLVDHMVSLLRDVLRAYSKSDGPLLSSPVLVSGLVPGHFCIPDVVKELGPIGGIYSVITVLLNRHEHYSKKFGVLFVPVDMPLLSEDVLIQLIVAWQNIDETVDVLHFRNQEFPLILKLSTQVHQVLAQMCSQRIPSSKRSVRNLHKALLAAVIDGEDPRTRPCFKNTNTPSEWRSLFLFSRGGLKEKDKSNNNYENL